MLGLSHTTKSSLTHLGPLHTSFLTFRKQFLRYLVAIHSELNIEQFIASNVFNLTILHPKLSFNFAYNQYSHKNLRILLMCFSSFFANTNRSSRRPKASLPRYLWEFWFITPWGVANAFVNPKLRILY